MAADGLIVGRADRQPDHHRPAQAADGPAARPERRPGDRGEADRDARRRARSRRCRSGWTSGCCGRGSPGFIAVGGSLTPQWKGLALPAMHALTFSLQAAVVDQIVIAGAGTPQSVVLDDDALARSRRSSAATSPRSSAGTLRGGGVRRAARAVPAVPPRRRRAARAAPCSARPAAPRAGSTTTARSSWTDLDTSVISMAEKRDHYDEILETAQRHAEVRDEITEKAAAYASYDPARPTRDR